MKQKNGLLSMLTIFDSSVPACCELSFRQHALRYVSCSVPVTILSLSIEFIKE